MNPGHGIVSSVEVDLVRVLPTKKPKSAIDPLSPPVSAKGLEDMTPRDTKFWNDFCFVLVEILLCICRKDTSIDQNAQGALLDRTGEWLTDETVVNIQDFSNSTFAGSGRVRHQTNERRLGVSWMAGLIRGHHHS
jgi:hypothetical protein